MKGYLWGWIHFQRKITDMESSPPSQWDVRLMEKIFTFSTYRVVLILVRFQLLERQFPVCKTSLPLQDGGNIFQLYPFIFQYSVYTFRGSNSYQNCFYHPSEKGSTLKGKNCFTFQKGAWFSVLGLQYYWMYRNIGLLPHLSKKARGELLWSSCVCHALSVVDNVFKWHILLNCWSKLHQTEQKCFFFSKEIFQAKN